MQLQSLLSPSVWTRENSPNNFQQRKNLSSKKEQHGGMSHRDKIDVIQMTMDKHDDTIINRLRNGSRRTPEQHKVSPNTPESHDLLADSMHTRRETRGWILRRTERVREFLVSIPVFNFCVIVRVSSFLFPVLFLMVFSSCVYPVSLFLYFLSVPAPPWLVLPVPC